MSISVWEGQEYEIPMRVRVLAAGREGPDIDVELSAGGLTTIPISEFTADRLVRPPLEVGKRCRWRANNGGGRPGVVVGIDGDWAWVRWADKDSPATAAVSDLEMTP